MHTFGASLSLHRCYELRIDPRNVLYAALNNLDIRRFRLMTYWNLHEPSHGSYDLSDIQWQLDTIAAAGGTVTLCLGLRQPRWPEFHMPAWAENLPSAEWHLALLEYIGAVVVRFKDHPAVESWQLENEALLKSFGHGVNIDFDRDRLNKEYAHIKSLDATHPVIMTLSDNWGMPWSTPKPDAYGMSLYRISMRQNGTVAHSPVPPLFYRTRATLVHLLKHRPVFIHELQMEPWFNQGITDVPLEQQLAQMGPDQLTRHIRFARSTGIQTIDLWGLEWWYWLKTTYNEPTVWQTIQKITSN